ncbi:MAG: copper amine oxidase N-terminal domain-containing protein [Clostridiales bacterium]|jgi:hypothetical protein|nr:copper amine oxidase N-terminal domain-containing protein [Clostridiales bacterium]
MRKVNGRRPIAWLLAVVMLFSGLFVVPVGADEGRPPEQEAQTEMPTYPEPAPETNDPENEENIQIAPQNYPPVLTISGSIITWSTIGNPREFTIDADYIEMVSLGPYSTYFDLNDLQLTAGRTYTITVTAYFLVDGLAEMALTSNGVTFTVPSTGQPIAPTISIEGSILSWDLVDGATHYLLYVDGDRQELLWDTPFDLRHLLLGLGTHQIQLRAARGWTGIESELSNAVTFVQDLPQLSAPTISLDGAILSWVQIATTSNIFIYVDGDRIHNISGMPFANLTFLGLDAGSYEIQIRVFETGFTISELSNAVTFVSDGGSLTPFPAPTISIDGSMLSWTLVDGATHYPLYVDGERHPSSAWNMPFNLRQLGLGLGTHQIQLRTGENWVVGLESELSNTVEFVVAPVAPPQEGEIANIAIEYRFRETTVTASTWVNPFTITGITLAEGTGFAPFTPVRAEIWREGSDWPVNTTTTNFDTMGINPNDPMHLSSRTDWSWNISHWVSSTAGSNTYTLRIFVGNILITESEPIRITVVDPGVPVDPSRFTVDFRYINTELTAAVGDMRTFWPVEHSFILDDGEGFTSSTPVLPVQTFWYRNGQRIWSHSRSSITLGSLGINPVNPGELAGHHQSNSFQFNSVTEADAGYYTLRVYMGGSWTWNPDTMENIWEGNFIGESNPIRLNVVDFVEPDFDLVNIEFDYRFINITATEGEYVTWGFEPVRVNLTLENTNTRLTPFTPVDWRWVRDDGHIRSSHRRNLSNFGIDPLNPQNLSGGIDVSWFFWFTNNLWQVRMQDAGIYRLHIYIADERVAISDTFTVNVNPDPGIANMVVDFTYHTREINVAVAGGPGPGVPQAQSIPPPDPPPVPWPPSPGPGGPTPTTQPITVDIDLVRVSPTTVLTPTTQVLFRWYSADLDIGGFPFPGFIVGIASLQQLGIDPRDPNALTGTFTPHVALAFAGDFVLQVEILDRIIATSDPIRVNFITEPPPTQTGGVRFTYQNFPTRPSPQPQSGSTHLYAIEFEVLVSDNEAVQFQWFRNGRPFGTPLSEADAAATHGPDNRITLELANVNSANHNGEWWLEAYVFVDGHMAFRDRSRSSFLEVREAEEPSWPGNGGGEDTTGNGAEPTPPTPPPTPPPPTPQTHAQNSNEIREQLRNDEAEEIVLALEEGVDEVRLFGSALNLLIDAETDLVVETYSGMQLTISTELLQEMIARAYPLSATGNFVITVRDDIEIEAGQNEDIYAGLAIEVTINGAQIATFDTPLTIVYEFNSPSPYINPFRMTAVDSEGNRIGGIFDVEAMTFTFETYNTGYFTIEYIEDLRRLSLSLHSAFISDLAQPDLNIAPMDVLPVIQEDRTLVPVRFMAYALGADIDWTPATETDPLTVFLTLDGQTLVIPIGQLSEELAELGMDVPAQIIDDRTMVPLRFISEFFGAQVSWDGDARSIEIIK